MTSIIQGTIIQEVITQEIKLRAPGRVSGKPTKYRCAECMVRERAGEELPS